MINTIQFHRIAKLHIATTEYGVEVTAVDPEGHKQEVTFFKDKDQEVALFLGEPE